MLILSGPNCKITSTVQKSIGWVQVI